MQQTILVCDWCTGGKATPATALVSVSVNRAAPLRLDFCPRHLADFVRACRRRRVAGPGAAAPAGSRASRKQQRAAFLRYLSTQGKPAKLAEIPETVTGGSRKFLYSVLAALRVAELVNATGPKSARVVSLTAKGRAAVATLDAPPDAAPARSETPDARRRHILEQLAASSAPVPTRGIVSPPGVERGAMRDSIRRAVEVGLAEQLGEGRQGGKYRITPAGRAWLRDGKLPKAAAGPPRSKQTTVARAARRATRRPRRYSPRRGRR